MDIHDFLVILSLTIYAVSAVGYATNFQHPSQFRGRVASLALIIGFGTHSLMLTTMTISLGRIPLDSQSLSSLCAWLVVIVYLYLEFSTRDRSLGALVVPIVLLLHLLAVSNLIDMEKTPQVQHTDRWFHLHVLTYILAYAAFAISCVSSIMFLMLFGEIQKKHLGFFYERIPSLEILNQINNRAATFGFVFLSTGIIASSVLSYQELYRLWIWSEPAFVPLLLTWLIYAGHLFARWFAGWQGKRASIISIAGFMLVVLAFPVVGLLFSGKHSIGQ